VTAITAEGSLVMFSRARVGSSGTLLSLEYDWQEDR
jgi:hypothetical protein